ncbi:MAG TPA: type II toxin-antitoxin system VapC family toxin [Terracidiphilus sp.]|jgi:PIN domain nuclease of toxin-antitoxin system|nr:type II toxin-antitoxin system VapC family toxin [Terracidiphilus sp.]
MILLDSHVAVWLSESPERISSRAKEAIRGAVARGETLALPAAAVFEIATEIRKGRIQLRVPVQTYFEKMTSRLRVIPVSGEIARCAGELPRSFHNDPLDRLIVSTAIVENATLITSDQPIRASGVCRTIW